MDEPGFSPANSAAVGERSCPFGSVATVAARSQVAHWINRSKNNLD